MPDKGETSNLIEAMARHEEAICELYTAFAGQAPADREFWYKIAEEELEHASWLRAFDQRMKEGEIRPDEKRFKLKAVVSSMKFVQAKTEEARSKPLEPRQALSTAISVETAMIEEKLFEVFKTDAPALVKILDVLASGTKEHLARLRSRLNP